MKRNKENDVSKESQPGSKKSKVLSLVSLIASILAYPLSVIIWLGISLSVLAIVCGIMNIYYFKTNRVIKVSLILAFLYVITILLCLIIFGIYKSILGI